MKFTSVILIVIYTLCAQAAAEPVNLEVYKLPIPGGYSRPVTQVSTDGNAIIHYDGYHGGGTVFNVKTQKKINIPPVLGAAAVQSGMTVVTFVSYNGRYLIRFIDNPNQQSMNVVILDSSSLDVKWSSEVSRSVGFDPSSFYDVHYSDESNILKIATHTLIYILRLKPEGGWALRHTSTIVRDLTGSHYSNVQPAKFSSNGSSIFFGPISGDLFHIALTDSSSSLIKRKKISAPDTDEKGIHRLVCWNDCRNLLATIGNFRTHVVSLDSETFNIDAEFRQPRGSRLISIGDDKFAYSQNGRTVFILDKLMRQILSVDLGDVSAGVNYGYEGGLIIFTEKPSRTTVMMSVDDLVKAQDTRATVATNRKREAESNLVAFRAKLVTGSDTHCGLVIDRKAAIAQIETSIGTKWLKVEHLYPQGQAPCRFVNGAYQLP